MGKTIGSAADFYRLRVIRVDATDGLDLEWRDDILYRRPPADRPHETHSFTVEAVLLDDDDTTMTLATFDSSDEAHAWLSDAETALVEMTKSQFEEAYFPE